MKKLICLFLLGISVFYFSQVQRFTYEYKYTNDSLKKDSMKKDFMFLDVTKTGSKFYSKKKFDSDSITLASISTQMKANPGKISVSRSMDGNSGSDLVIEKTYPDFTIYQLTSIGSGIGDNDYKVLDNRKLDWKILSDKQKIGEWDVQKATVNFGGRKWTAWFTTEIPFQDGPYKFHGLPGLIVKMEDASHTHIFELQAVKKYAEKTLSKEEIDARAYVDKMNKKLSITQAQYDKLYKQYLNDPVQGTREMLSNPNSKVKININGRLYEDKKDVIREIEKMARQNIKDNNNLIEIYKI